MSYKMQSGEWADTQDLILHASGAETTDTNSGKTETGDKRTAALILDVTAVSGTNPTLDVTVQTSKDGVNNWYTAGTFAQKTGVAAERKTFVLDRFVRVSWAITGTATPTFTFSITGEAA